MNTHSDDQTPILNLRTDPVSLTEELVNIYSESHHEKIIADACEQALYALRDEENSKHDDRNLIPSISIDRHGNTLIARTHRNYDSRVILAGHLDTVPPADNLPSHRQGDNLYGLGTVDMKSGDAVYLHAFASLAYSPDLRHDLTLILYEGEEVATEFNGLGHIAQNHPDLIHGDLALLGEPSSGIIEAGCQGTIRVKVTAQGVRAHSARSWLGDNAMHRLSEVIGRISSHTPRQVSIDGMEYREGINVVTCHSGVATNTIPDEAWMFVNFRFAPDRSVDEALDYLYEVLAVGTPDNPHPQFLIEVDDAAPGALPGLSHPTAGALLDAVGGQARAKFGWTDVARFTEFGIPALNFGPGDPNLCHTPQEHCPISMIEDVSKKLLSYLCTEV